MSINMDASALDEKARFTGGHSVEFASETTAENSKPKIQRTIVYVGNMPRGFEESEMKRYFRQFGDVLRVRRSRIKRTGKPRPYGFVEFADRNVAQVACETMNNYLIYGQMLKVHIMVQPLPSVFAPKLSTRFREFDNWSKEYKELHKKRPLAEWEQLQEKYEQDKKEVFAKLAAAGFNYSL